MRKTDSICSFALSVYGLGKESRIATGALLKVEYQLCTCIHSLCCSSRINLISQKTIIFARDSRPKELVMEDYGVDIRILSRKYGIKLFLQQLGLFM